MKLEEDVTINGELWRKGTEIPWYLVYPVLLLELLIFGGSVFWMAYGKDSHGNSAPIFFLYLWGGLAAFIFAVLYGQMFGRDEIKWMFINAALGVFGIYSQMGWILSLIGKRMSDYPFYVHAVPFFHFVLGAFLLRHAVLDLTASRLDPVRRKRAETAYVVISAAIYAVSLAMGKR